MDLVTGLSDQRSTPDSVVNHLKTGFSALARGIRPRSAAVAEGAAGASDGGDALACISQSMRWHMLFLHFEDCR